MTLHPLQAGMSLGAVCPCSHLVGIHSKGPDGVWSCPLCSMTTVTKTYVQFFLNAEPYTVEAVSIVPVIGDHVWLDVSAYRVTKRVIKVDTDEICIYLETLPVQKITNRCPHCHETMFHTVGCIYATGDNWNRVI